VNKRIRERVESYCTAHDLIQGGSGLVLAVSGGPDSMALLEIFEEIGRNRDIKLAVAHLNHGSRGKDSDDDERFVRQQALLRHLTFYSRTADLDRESKKGESFEQAARRIRYAYLLEVMEKTGAVAVATGHTRDDNVETILFRLLTGTGPAGIRGISPRTGPVIHPLIDISREDILRFLHEEDIPYRIDRTNQDRSRPRNRIRHDLFPLLEGINGRFRDHILDLAGIVADEDGLIDTLVDDAMRGVVERRRDGSIRLPWDRFGEMPPAIRRRVIRRMAAEFGREEGETGFFGEQFLLSRRVVENLIDTGMTGNKTLYSGGPVSIRKEYGWLVFEKNVVREKVKNYLYPVEISGSPTLIREICRDLVCSVTEKVTEYENNCMYFDLSMVTPPLFVRNRRPGDRIRLEGVGDKKIKDLFIDQKVPRFSRDAVPLVACNNRVVGVFGSLYGADNRVAEGWGVTSDTREILVLRLGECESPVDGLMDRGY
jgi:tRNA(Ile)-lysidine synthase